MYIINSKRFDKWRNAFITTWDIPDDDFEFQFPIVGVGNNYWIDWGDGTEPIHYTTELPKHTYALAGEYDISIKGVVKNISSYSTANFPVTQIGLGKRVVNWGGLGLTNVNHICYNWGIESIPDMPFPKTTVSNPTFGSTFYGNNLTTIPASFFDNYTDIKTLSYTFKNNKIASIPANLFSKLTSLVQLAGVFYSNSLTSIPSGLFDSCTEVTSFQQCFYSNSLTSIPSGLFDSCTKVTSFQQCFYSNSLTSIPSGLFDSCTEVTSFTGCFQQNQLTSIPSGLFDSCTEVTSFQQCFHSNSLTSIPSGLFEYNRKAINFIYTFYLNNQLTLNPNIFSTTNDHSRFKDISALLGQCFQRSGVAFTGIQGEAPDLWNYDFGTGTPQIGLCFDGHTAATLSNYNDIPAEWK